MQQFFAERVESRSRRLAGDKLQRFSQRSIVSRGGLERAPARRVHQLGALQIVDDAEGCRNIGFERKDMQQLFAEGVDGLDLEAARRLDGAREKPPGEVKIDARFDGRAHLSDFIGQRRIVERRPARERLENARAHIGGGRLRIGEAENLRRPRAGKQQPQNALREHMGFPGAGMRRNPGGRERI